MKKIMLWGLLSVMLVTLLVIGQAYAEAKKVTVKGEVSVEKDDDGNLTAVTLVAADAEYKVTLDAKGKELGEKMAGKNVEATGTVSEKDEAKWLTVEKYSEVKEEAPAPEGGDGDALE